MPLPTSGLQFKGIGSSLVPTSDAPSPLVDRWRSANNARQLLPTGNVAYVNSDSLGISAGIPNFNSNLARLEVNDLGISAGDPWTIIIYSKMGLSGQPEPNGPMIFSDSDNARSAFLFGSEAFGTTKFGLNIYSSGVEHTFTTTANYDINAHIHLLELSNNTAGASLSGNLKYFIDNTDVTPSLGINLGTNVLNDLILTAFYRAVYYGVVVYNRTLTTLEKTAVYNYFNSGEHKLDQSISDFIALNESILVKSPIKRTLSDTLSFTERAGRILAQSRSDTLTLTDSATALKISAPIIKTIKPLGGGDYTSLASWWAAVKTSLIPNQWAECYPGGDLGNVDLDTASFTATSTSYPRIYGVAGSRPDGTNRQDAVHLDSSTGEAQIKVQVPFFHIDGLVFNRATIPAIALLTHDCVVENNLIIKSGTTTYSVTSSTISFDLTNNIVRNNIHYVEGNSIPIAINFSAGTGVTVNSTGTLFHNNSLVAETQVSSTVGFHVDNGLTLTVKNTAIFNFPICFQLGTGVTASNNVSSDSTGSITSKTAVNQYRNALNNWNLLSTADCKDAGGAITGFTQSQNGLTRTGTIDIGPTEYDSAQDSTPLSYTGAILQDVPFVWYKNNSSSGSVMVDSSGYSRNGAYSGSPTYLQNRLSSDSTKAILMHATTDSGTLLTKILSQSLTKFGTIEIWFKTTDSNHSLLTNNLGSSRNLLDINSAGKVRMFDGTVLTSTAKNDGTAHLATLVFTDSQWQLYVDGTSIGTQSLAPTTNYTFNDTTIFGGNLIATIGSVVIYRDSLSSTKVALHYTLGSAAHSFDFSESLTFNEIVFGVTGGVLSRTVSDNLILSEFCSNNIGNRFPVAETLILTDSAIFKQNPRHLSLSETLSINETINYKQNPLRFILPETLGPFSETIRISLIKETLLESISFIEIIRNNIHNQLVSELLTFNEHIHSNQWTTTVFDTLVLGEILHGPTQYTVNDILTLSESLHISPFKFTAFETLNFIEAATAYIFRSNQPVSEQIIFNEIVNVFRNRVTVSDTLTLIEAVKVRSNHQFVSDFLALTEQMTRFKFDLYDTLTLTEQVFRVKPVNVFENLILNETLTAIASKLVSDKLTLLEEVCFNGHFGQTVSDNLILKESAGYIFGNPIKNNPLGGRVIGPIDIKYTIKRNMNDALILNELVAVEGGQNLGANCNFIVN